MGFFTSLFSVGKKLFVPVVNIAKKAALPIANLGRKIGSSISSGFQRVKNIFKSTPKPRTQLSEPLLGSIPNPSQIDKIVKLGQQMPVKQSWQTIRESGKAIGGVSKKGAGGLTKAQRIAQETKRINEMGKKLNQADYITDMLQL